MDKECVNFLRLTSVNQIKSAQSGHTGICLGSAPILFEIYKNAFFNPKMPNYINRDRIVFSAGHASALIYSCLYLFGFDLSIEDLKNFRQLNSKTPGHPEVNVTPGIDVSTGPLGQGIANAVGFAIAEEYMSNCFNKGNLKPIDHYTYCFCGDGCLMEGVAQEAISLAGNLKLNKLILLYDKNDITIEGKLDLSNTEKTNQKFLAMNWNVIEVEDGSSTLEIENAIQNAKKSDKPTVIIIKTHIGYGCEFVGSNKIHGKPLNAQQIDILRQNLGYFVPDWQISNNAQYYAKSLVEKKQIKFQNQQNDLEEYKKKFPEKYKEFCQLNNNFNFDFGSLIKNVNEETFDGREELNKILNNLYEIMPNFIGGCADVASSTKAFFSSSSFFTSRNKANRNLAFGVREHAMAAISNGVALYGGLRVFCSTFLAFANYLTPALRLSALMSAPVLYLFTHDSLAVGEDGPTHQSIEQIATLRAIPDIFVFRPSGRNELLASFQTYFDNKKPCVIILPRQILNQVGDKFEETKNGAYIISKSKNAVATLIATGSEVELCLKAQKLLFNKKISINVVSMPNEKLFASQKIKYKNSTIDKSKPVFCVEASSDNLWFKYASDEDCILKMNSFGKSGKGEDVYASFGFTPKNIVNMIEKKLKI